MQTGRSRADALKQLVARTEVSELRHFVLAVLQAEGHGVPVAKILRLQAAELRMKRRQRAEENAMKLPVKILFPLVLCILPTIFAVLLGPAAIRISQTLGT
ncbi:MAG: type II secretion system F family protein [Acidimicrobiales bacterium]